MSFKKFLPDLDEQKKNDSIAAGSNIMSNHSVQPPAQMLQPIQGMFPNSSIMDMDSKKKSGMISPMDISKTPSPAGPVPIPYPNIGKPQQSPKSFNPSYGSKSPTIKNGSDTGISMGGMAGISPNFLPGKASKPIPYPGQGGFDPIKKDGPGKKQGFIGKAFSGISKVISKGAGKISDYASDFSSGFLGKGADFMNAVNFAKTMFKLQAGFKNVTINGSSAFGMPGCLDGPDLELFIKAAPSVAAMQGNDKKMRDAIAKGVAQNFKEWRKKVMVPGLPWYPAFSAFPAPHAPPTPNVPTPLFSCPSSAVSKIINPLQLKSSIKSNLPAELKTPETEAFLDGFCAQLAATFSIWLATQQIMLVMGKGPVPSWSPPQIPVGPVVNGDIISAPGHLMT